MADRCEVLEEVLLMFVIENLIGVVAAAAAVAVLVVGPVLRERWKGRRRRK